MRLLADTNIFLEIILDQEKAGQAQKLLATGKGMEFFVSDFCLHSIGLLLFKLGKHAVFLEFLNDMVFQAGLNVISLPLKDFQMIHDAALKFSLDFDDAYQYALSQKYDLTILSFDGDFDRTDKGRKTPTQVLAGEA